MGQGGGRGPVAGNGWSSDAIETLIVPRTSDIGGFSVRRALPSARRRMIGPFIFLDHMGPAEFILGEGIDVRPHPHIGLSTLTYLYSGEIMHRDSIGVAQAIRPGAVNWMTAGRGIVHSERTPEERRKGGEVLHGVQIWVALGEGEEEAEPGFCHFAASGNPLVEDFGMKARLISGSLFGASAPLTGPNDMICADVELAAGAVLPLDADERERGIYVAQGSLEIAGDVFASGQLLVLRPGDGLSVRAQGPCRLLYFGGEPMAGPRHIWWNFVSSSRERIEQAKRDWKEGRFAPVPGESDFIPLPR
ncbi:MAG: pirin family protein [Rhodobiaceae bacterium]|nr:pirin family protein [Rhodobiaceae bacterium]